VTDAIANLRLSKGQSFVSGDYEAATDRIHLHYTLFTCNSMLDRTTFTFPQILVDQYGQQCLEDWFRRYSLHSFGSIFVANSPLDTEAGSEFLSWNTRLHSQSGDNDTKTVKEENKCVQFTQVKRGQMMGHILSFPLLCIINKSASSMCLPKDRFIRINGDDVLFPASKQEYRLWERNTRHVGLKKSVGKNYYSRNMAMINSEVYTWSKQSNRLVRLVFPNVGLLGYIADFVDAKGRQVTPWEQLSGILKDFWAGVPEAHHHHAKRLIRERYPIIGGFPGSWFGPTALGNLGLPVPSGHQYTRYQRLWMEAHRAGLYSYREGLLTDFSRIETLYQKEIPLQDEFLEWGVPDGQMPPEDILPDPYSRSGGLARELMQIKRWVTKIPTQKKFRVFGRRRFNRFLMKRNTEGRPLAPLSGSALQSVLQNCWSDDRPRWFHSRRGYQPDLAQPFTLPF